MERKKHSITLIGLFFLLPVVAFSQNSTMLYKAYVAGDMTQWKRSIDSSLSVGNHTNEALLQLVNYLYGYIAYFIGTERKEEAEKYVAVQEEFIEQLEKQNYKLSYVYAYKSALLGFKIGLAPYKGLYLGTRSRNYARQSVNAEPDNPLGHIQLGNIAWFTPSLFGGSKEEALKHYVSALALMEATPQWTKNNWNYLNLLAIIIQAYMELKHYELAEKYCIKALTIEPEFDWIKNTLYPQIIERLKG